MNEPSLPARALRYALFVAIAFFAYKNVYLPSLMLWNTHRLVVSLASDLPVATSATSNTPLLRQIPVMYRAQAADIGALPDADIDVSVDGQSFVVTATGEAAASLGKCCKLVYWASLASNQRFFDALKTHQE
jgi:hypothetical protein